MASVEYAAHGPDDTHSCPAGWRRYVYSTNHKDIGTMYFVFAICAGLIGGVGMSSSAQAFFRSRAW
jgi:cytochrome c oxidase subunit 1